MRCDQLPKGAVWLLFTTAYNDSDKGQEDAVASSGLKHVLIPIPSAIGQTLNDDKLHVREVASGLVEPTAFIGPGDILVLQKGDGRVRRIINGVLQPGEVCGCGRR
jgi:hypothetical protein